MEHDTTVNIKGRVITLYGSLKIKGKGYYIIKLGVSICNTKHGKFDKELGLKIAKGRSEKKPTFTAVFHVRNAEESTLNRILISNMSVIAYDLYKNPNMLINIINLKKDNHDRNRENSNKGKDKSPKGAFGYMPAVTA